MAKEQAIIDLSNQRNKKLAIDAIKAAQGLHWWVLTKCRNQRSLSQNAYYFGVVLPAVAVGIREAWGEQLFTVDDAHEFCKNRFLSNPVVNRKTGEVQGNVVRSTTSLDTAEFSQYLDEIFKFAADYLGVEIPAANQFSEPAEAS